LNPILQKSLNGLISDVVLAGIYRLKRVDIMDFLNEVLRVCGESVTMDIVWLKKTETAISAEEADYQLVVKSSRGLSDEECLNQIVEKFGMKMEKQGEFWIFSKK
jgi:hypothetical protein